MRIGFVSEAVPYLPCREGFRIYGANLMRCLSREHELDLVALAGTADGAHVDWAKAHAASVATVGVHDHGFTARVANAVSGYLVGRPRHYRAALAELVAPGGVVQAWDVIHVEGPFAGGLVGGVNMPKILSIHDSATGRWRELARRARSARERARAVLMGLYARRYERLAYPRFDRCVVVTEHERSVLATVAPTARVEVIGNGTDTEYFKPPSCREQQEGVLVFHGNLKYPPNVAGALEFADDVFPRIRGRVPGATLHLVGADPAAEVRSLASRPGIRLFADVPDVRPFLAAARVYVCAIRHAGGIKNKLLEAMAMALPVVTYTQAASGITCTPGSDVVVAETSVEFSDRVVELLEAPERAHALGDNARRLMLGHYSWESRAAAFVGLYREVLGARADQRASVVKARG